MVTNEGEERLEHGRVKARRYYHENRDAVLAKRRERYAKLKATSDRLGIVSYSRAHARVEERRGKASEYLCSACMEREAADWACRKDASHIAVEGTDGFSLMASSYVPLCRSCHWRLDHGRLTGAWIKWRELAA